MSEYLTARVEKVIDYMIVLGLYGTDRTDFELRVKKANEFSDLPETDRRAIQAAERIAKSGVTVSDLLKLPEVEG